VTDPLVSIVVPAFNAEATLRETVESALASSFREFELIIVDDGSTDRTAEIARELARSDARVRLVQRANGGLPAALNSGFAVARGDYLARLDSDDLWHPDKLKRQMELARRKPDAAFIYTFFRYIDEQGRVLRDGPEQRFPERALARGVYETILGTGSSVLMKRSAIEEAGGCEESPRTWEDLLLQLKVSARHPIAFVPEYLVGIRVRSDSLSQGRQAMLAGWLELRRRIRELFPQVPRYVHDWGHASRCVQMAESFAWQGKFRRCAALLFDALRHDPQYVRRFLQYRLARRIRVHNARPQRSLPGAPFPLWDPAETSRLDPFGLPGEGGALLRLHEKRVRMLAALDEELATPANGELCSATLE
jgi:glycosyltransferase involved in cell wall biosynthesis